MNAMSGAYAQRLMITIFLVSFGIYLLLATVTYTPFDPGWMRLSSDTTQVSNASGLAGTWIADLLRGFLGWSCILIPVFLFNEAVQVWWKHSFLTAPLRMVAALFIMLCVACLFYLHWHGDVRTIENSAGGIIGYELGRNLAGLMTVIGATVFLALFLTALVTFVFGIRWNRTLYLLKNIPHFLQDLFYRNVPESVSDYDLTLGKAHAEETRVAKRKQETEKPAPVAARKNPLDALKRKLPMRNLHQDDTRADDTDFVANLPQSEPYRSSYNQYQNHQQLNDESDFSNEDYSNEQLSDEEYSDRQYHVGERFEFDRKPTEQDDSLDLYQDFTPTRTSRKKRAQSYDQPYEATYQADQIHTDYQQQETIEQMDYSHPDVFSVEPSEHHAEYETKPLIQQDFEIDDDYGSQQETDFQTADYPHYDVDLSEQDETYEQDEQNYLTNNDAEYEDAEYDDEVYAFSSKQNIEAQPDLSQRLNFNPKFEPQSEQPNFINERTVPSILDQFDSSDSTSDIEQTYAEQPTPKPNMNYRFDPNELKSMTPKTKAKQSASELSSLAQILDEPKLNMPAQDFHTEAKTDFSDEDLDAPLTDASNRVMSRSMRVAKKRAKLSPLPGLELLDAVDPNKKVQFSEEQLYRLSQLLEMKLQEFNVKATVVNALPGPVVTRFELELAPGVKVSKVTNISRDLARSMSMASVRVVEVIPGKPYIGIEVPNLEREMVRLTELLHTEEYRNPNALLSVAMGKDIAGIPIVTDLAAAPHMLVAGTTGSGKSVAVNAMLLSMLMKYSPDQLRLILIDPKQLELANYNDIPHLLTPVVTDMKDAVSALNWCVNEMERRYKLMAYLKIRKITDYNRIVNKALAEGQDLIDPTWQPSDSAVRERAPRLQPLPSIVIVADEFADMIMQVGKKAEEMITRLAQKSRAAGIHLLLATQRPSVDVITGLIKANIPTRVALRVNSKIDSRTILDSGGAEDLLGHGDMLFLAPGKIEAERVHGAFISDDEVNRVCDAWRERGDPDYVDDILTPFDEDSSSRGGVYNDADVERDVLYDQAVAFILETRKASVSSLQRKFSLGYNRAARVMDQIEEAGIVSPQGSNGKRDILV